MNEMDDLATRAMNALLAGPSSVIDVSERLGRDTLQTTAILDYYVRRGKIRRTLRNYGSSPIYFLPKDEEQAMKKLFDSLSEEEGALVEKVKGAKVIKSTDLLPAERYLSQSVQDFIKRVVARDSDSGEETEYLYYYRLTQDELSSIINSSQPQVKSREAPSKDRSTIAPKRLNKSQATIDISRMDELGFAGVKPLGKGLYAAVYGKAGVNVLVMPVSKTILSKSDVTKAMGYALEYKKLVFILTSATKIPKTLDNGDLVKIINV